jgi:imidazolonepropionase-like amidohydrolase
VLISIGDEFALGQKMNRMLPALLAVLMLVVPAGAQTTWGKIALVGARVIDGTGNAPIEDATVLISGGTIQAVGESNAIRIPASYQKIDVEGKTLMPLLVDDHAHLGQTINGLDPVMDAYNEENIRAQLEHLLAYGVGTIAVMGTDRELIYTLRQDQQAGKLPGAHFYTAGRGFGVKGGAPGGAGAAWDVNRPDTPEEARAEVREVAAHHPSFVKIWVDDNYGRAPKMKPEIYRAIIDEAHRHQLRALAHVYYLDDAKSLLAAGIDGLMHSIRDQPVDPEGIAALKARNVLYVPTLVRDESTFIYADGPPWLGDPFFRAGVLGTVFDKLQSTAFQRHAASDPDLGKNSDSLRMAEVNLKTLFDAGVRVGFGTDAGMPGRFLGYFEHRELQLMVQSGLTPMEAIVCATRTAAGFLARDFGTLQPGQRADIMVLDANPLDDIRNTEKVVGVWQEGRPVKPISPQ